MFGSGNGRSMRGHEGASQKTRSQGGKNLNASFGHLSLSKSDFLRIVGLLLLSTVSVFACVAFGSSGAIAISIVDSLIISFLYPRHWWPASALCLTLLVPFSYVPGSAATSVFTAGTLVMVIYVFSGTGKKPTWLRDGLPILVFLSSIYLLILVPLGSSDNNLRKLLWAGLIVVIMLLPAIVTNARETAASILWVVIFTGFILSVLGIIEYFLKENPLADFFANASSPLTQKWGDYRIFTLMGHPLVNALFLAMSGTIALAVFLRRRYTPGLVLLVLTGVALIFTQSRTGIAALVVGVSLVLLGSARGQLWRRTMMAITLLAFAIVVFFQVDNPLIQRNASLEGQGSSELRFAYLEVLPVLMDAASVWGTGAGTSDSALQDIGGYAASFPIESSAIQLLVSLGVVGFALLALTVAGVLFSAWRRKAVMGPSVFAAYCVAAAGFNLFEAYPPLIVIPGALLVLTVAEADDQLLPNRSYAGEAGGGGQK